MESPSASLDSLMLPLPPMHSGKIYQLALEIIQQRWQRRGNEEAKNHMDGVKEEARDYMDRANENANGE